MMVVFLPAMMKRGKLYQIYGTSTGCNDLNEAGIDLNILNVSGLRKVLNH